MRHRAHGGRRYGTREVLTWQYPSKRRAAAPLTPVAPPTAGSTPRRVPSARSAALPSFRTTCAPTAVTTRIARSSSPSSPRHRLACQAGSRVGAGLLLCGRPSRRSVAWCASNVLHLQLPRLWAFSLPNLRKPPQNVGLGGIKQPEPSQTYIKARRTWVWEGPSRDVGRASPGESACRAQLVFRFGEGLSFCRRSTSCRESVRGVCERKDQS